MAFQLLMSDIHCSSEILQFLLSLICSLAGRIFLVVLSAALEELWTAYVQAKAIFLSANGSQDAILG